MLETALVVRDALEAPGHEAAGQDQRLEGHSPLRPDRARARCRRTSGEFAKALAKQLEQQHPKLITAEYRIAKRPRGRVLVDYNQNAWGRTLASIYSVRPTEQATVSTPVTWQEVERGFDDRGLPDRQRARAACGNSAISGSRSSRPEGDMIWEDSSHRMHDLRIQW